MANDKHRATSNAGGKSGHVVTSAFCSLPSLFIEFVCQAISLLINLSTEGHGQKISQSARWKVDQTISQTVSKLAKQSQAARQSIDRSVS